MFCHLHRLPSLLYDFLPEIKAAGDQNKCSVTLNKGVDTLGSNMVGNVEDNITTQHIYSRGLVAFRLSFRCFSRTKIKICFFNF